VDASGGGRWPARLAGAAVGLLTYALLAMLEFVENPHAGDDGSVRIRDAATGQQRAQLSKCTAWVWAMAVAPDGSWLASAYAPSRALQRRGAGGASLRSRRFTPPPRCGAVCCGPCHSSLVVV
jgi:hypothetical protein